MRARGLLLVPALAIVIGSASCPRIEDAAWLASRVASRFAAARELSAPLPVIAAPSPAAPVALAPPPAPTFEAPIAAPIEPSVADPTALEIEATEPDPIVIEEPIEPEPASREVFELASVARETWVFAEPRWGSKRLGYLRAGAIVERRSRPSGWSSCTEGWYRIAPSGYVCVGSAATLNVFDPAVEASRRRPDMTTLPYTYAISRSPSPPLYARLPSEAEQRRAEPDLKGHLLKASRSSLDPAYVAPPAADPTPGVLLYDRPAPTLANTWRSPDALIVGFAKPRSGFALLSTFDHDGRRFGLTTELAVVPLDRMRVVRPSSFAGVSLSEEGASLPAAFIRSKRAFRYLEGDRGSIVMGDALGFREAVALASGADGEALVVRRGEVTFLRAKDGSLVREDQAVRVDRVRRPPAWASAGRRWIDVSILRQTLVAYEGVRPVYATLVSTGADGLGDPKKTRSTIQGAFLIHTKHITVTMDGEDGQEFDFRDVPFVQYFTEGFALHAAYWHDDFGTPRSHGCVNLSPIDAAWLFGWTTPDVPKGWHAALSLRKGTLVYTHP